MRTSRFSARVESYREEILVSGSAYLGTWLDAASREKIRVFIDDMSPSGAEINYEGTEKRIWDGHLLSADISVFEKMANDVVSRFLGRSVEAYTVLAYSNKPLPSNSRAELGRWHIDSLRRQMKVFMFLTDTTEASGPFEWVVGSHSVQFKVRALLGGHYWSFWPIHRGGTRKYSKLPDGWVEEELRNRHEIRPLLCGAGDVFLVDTSSVHRARPCREGARYALTAYYRN